MKRADGLPEPATAGEFYLASILDELRGLRGDRQQTPVEVQEIDFKVDDLVTKAKEPLLPPSNSKNRRNR